MQKLPPSLGLLSAYRQFVLYKLVPSRRQPGKMDKIPALIDGTTGFDPHNSRFWVSAEEACSAAQLLGDDYGVGFVFTSQDPFFFLDIDGAWDGKQWSPLATQLLNQFKGCAVEVSQSNKGLHIFGMYSGDEPEHACKNIPLHIELYTSGRFVALTGKNATGDVACLADTPLSDTISQHFACDATDGDSPVDWTDTHHRKVSQPILDDEKLIEKAKSVHSAGSVFGGGAVKASFADLWDRNVSVLSQVYPSETGQEFDASSADAALALHLLWWCGGNCERVERLMNLSGLVRDKWKNHKSYMKTTILNGARKCKEYFNPTRDTVIQEVDTIEISSTLREGLQLMSGDQQLDYFNGCVYVTEINKIFTPQGSFLDSARFNAVYGGYNFNIDFAGEKTTKKAFEAFTESQTCNFPKVDGTCFRPELESGSLLREFGRSLVNTYVDLDIPSIEGDVTPFLKHVELMLPDKRDRDILLSYMACCVQHKGYKIQWAPVIQGVEGNGKTLIMRALKHAIGKPYVHLPKAENIDNNFNAWLVNKLFIGVEEIYVPGHRAELLEALKPMITNEDIGVEFKGVDQTTKDICCNFLFATNHKDAIPINDNSRRYCIFYTAQQHINDLDVCGMTPDYFHNLYGWCKSGGYANITHYLENFDIIAEFNPTTNCQRAPKTTSTTEAVKLSLGTVEQEILEAIEQGRSGFKGGWISSFAIDTLLSDMRKDKAVPRNKRREMLQKLGYDYHPALKDGRVNNQLMTATEQGKPRLFIKAGHIHSNLTNGSEVIRHYVQAQGEVFGKTIVDKPVNMNNN